MVLLVTLLVITGIYLIYKNKNQKTTQIVYIEDFQQIDNYPLYTARYIGDYKFEEYLKTGKRPNLTPFGCTCFSKNMIVGRNFDFPANPALLLYTEPEDGYKSISMVDLGFFGYSMSKHPKLPLGLEETPYLPFDGMNEKGLVVTMAAVPKATSPSGNQKSVGEIALIRLLLDYASNVDEAIDLLRSYNVLMDEPPIHYLVADASGDSVVVEYVDYKMKTYRSNNQSIITNFVLTGLNLPQESPCDRYNLVYSILMENNTLTKDNAFGLLRDSSQSSTIWSCVYDIDELGVHIVMGRNYGIVHTFYINKEN
jgi:hypothetical protein